jgi:hypothetical protein
MNDSSPFEDRAAKHDANDEQRLAGVKRWAEYIRNNPPDVWGPQQNELVNSQLESAQTTDLDLEHRAKIQAFADEMTGAADESPGE